MKKLFLSISTALFFAGAFAQTDQNARPISPVTDQFQNQNSYDYLQGTKVVSDSVPSALNTTYSKKYPDQKTTTWYRYNQGYRASYMDKDNMENNVIYDMNGNMIGSTKMIKSSSLPNGINDYMKKTYPSQPYTRVYEINPSTGQKGYIVWMNDRWVRFDSQGNYMPPK